MTINDSSPGLLVSTASTSEHDTPDEDRGRLLRVYNDNASVECCGYAVDGETLVLLDIVGHKTACKSLWATVVNSARKPFHIARDEGDICVSGGDIKRDTYAAFWADLPEQGVHNVVICHTRALDASPSPRANIKDLQPFYVADAFGDATEQASALTARFGAMLNQALDLPILPAWAPALWEIGIGTELVSELGCGGNVGRACRVLSDGDGWRKAVQDALQSGVITLHT